MSPLEGAEDDLARVENPSACMKIFLIYNWIFLENGRAAANSPRS
jgi:hypothetical protein